MPSKEKVENEEAAQDAAPRRILSGTDFIKETNSESLPELHEVKTCKGDVLVREVGQGISDNILVGQFVESNGNWVFGTLQTVERVFCMAIQQCVVNDKGEPLFTPANVKFMYTDEKKGVLYRDFLNECYAAVLEYNPHLDAGVDGNPTAYRRLIQNLRNQGL